MIQETIHRTCETGGIQDTAHYRIARGAEQHIARVLRNMYRNPITAVVREYLCNAVDANRLSGTSTPISIRVPTREDPVFRVRDFGPGLSRQDTERLLFGFGASGSEKRESNEFIGGFGLGCKSGFAVAQQFTYRVWHGGRCRTWVCALDQQDVAKAFLLHDRESQDPDGIEVEIPIQLDKVQECNDSVDETIALWSDRYVGKFKSEIRAQHRASEYCESIAGGVALRVEIQIPQGVATVWWNRSRYNSNDHKIVIGDPDVATRYEMPLEWRPGLEGHYTIQVPIGAVDLTPSRDDIMNTNRGTMVVKAAVAAVETRCREVAQQAYSTQDPAEWFRSLKIFTALEFPRQNKPGMLSNYRASTQWRGLHCDHETIYLPDRDPLDPRDSRELVALLHGDRIASRRGELCTGYRRNGACQHLVSIGSNAHRRDQSAPSLVPISARQRINSNEGNVTPGLIVRMPIGSLQGLTGTQYLIKALNRALQKSEGLQGKVWNPDGARVSSGSAWGWCWIVEARDQQDLETRYPWTRGISVWSPDLKVRTLTPEGRVVAPQQTTSVLYRHREHASWNGRGTWDPLDPGARKALLGSRGPIHYWILQDGEARDGYLMHGEVLQYSEKICGEILGIRAQDLELVRRHPKLGPRLEDARAKIVKTAETALRRAKIRLVLEGSIHEIPEGAEAAGLLESRFLKIPGFRKSAMGQLANLVNHRHVPENSPLLGAACVAYRFGNTASELVTEIQNAWFAVQKKSPVLAALLARESGRRNLGDEQEFESLVRIHIRACR